MEKEQKIAVEVMTLLARFIRVRNLETIQLLQDDNFYAMEDEVAKIIRSHGPG